MSTPSDYGAVHLLKENNLKQTELPYFHAFTLEYVFGMCTTEVGREDTLKKSKTEKNIPERQTPKNVTLGLVSSRLERRVIGGRIDSLAQRFEQLPSTFRIIFATRHRHNKRP
jgi:hypothetical protein